MCTTFQLLLSIRCEILSLSAEANGSVLLAIYYFDIFLIFRGKKSKISRDFWGQIRGKIGRFRGIFAGKKSKFVCVIKWWREKLGNNFTRVLSKSLYNYKDLDKTQVKLFPNFSRSTNSVDGEANWSGFVNFYCILQSLSYF